MRIISYIPIRSGSRGLKDKNILKIASKPLFEWSVYFAKNLSKNKDIIVSSDSERYLKLASKLKISTEKRPVELASDTSTTESAIIYTIKRLLDNNLVKPDDFFCLLQATSPIRRKILSTKLRELLSSNLYDSIISVNKETAFEWAYESEQFEYICPKYNLSQRPMRQMIINNKKERLIENGSFYCSRISSIISSKLRVSGKIGYLTCNEYEKLEIDNEDQYSLLDSILSHEINNGNANGFACYG